MRTKTLNQEGAPALAGIDRDPGGFFVALACGALIGGACLAAIIGLATRLV